METPELKKKNLSIMTKFGGFVDVSTGQYFKIITAYVLYAAQWRHIKITVVLC